MTMRPLGTPRPDLADDVKRRMIAAEPGLRMSDLVVDVYETVRETERIVLRPPTDEELAQIKIAEGINEADAARTTPPARRGRLSFCRPAA